MHQQYRRILQSLVSALAHTNAASRSAFHTNAASLSASQVYILACSDTVLTGDASDGFSR